MYRDDDFRWQMYDKDEYIETQILQDLEERAGLGKEDNLNIWPRDKKTIVVVALPTTRSQNIE